VKPKLFWLSSETEAKEGCRWRIYIGNCSIQTSIYGPIAALAVTMGR